jgi:glycosyltransferase involved in cell wall biosynthesis
MSFEVAQTAPVSSNQRTTVLMLLTNGYDPDPRVRQEALVLLAAGCRVRLLAWDRDSKAPASEVMEGIEVDRIFLASKHGRGTTQVFFYAALYLKMLWRGLRTSFDAVHCHDLDTLPLGFILAKLKRTSIVYDAHESFPDMLEGSVPAIVRRSLVSLENFLIRRTDLLITVGEKLRRHFAERGAPRSVVVGNWKRLEEYSRTEEQNAQVRHRLGIPDGAMVVVCITQLLKDRQIAELLEAVEACPEVYVIVGGKGSLEPLVRQWAAANPRILYVDFVRGADIPSYTSAADVVYYGFDPANPNARFSAPNKLFEALASGRPIITGNFGEIADVVREASCGIILEKYSRETVQDALTALLNPKLRTSMAENAHRFGRAVMNWTKGEQVLRSEYSRLLRIPLGSPLPLEATVETHEARVA